MRREEKYAIANVPGSPMIGCDRDCRTILLGRGTMFAKEGKMQKKGQKAARPFGSLGADHCGMQGCDAQIHPGTEYIYQFRNHSSEVAPARSQTKGEGRVREVKSREEEREKKKRKNRGPENMGKTRDFLTHEPFLGNATLHLTHSKSA